MPVQKYYEGQEFPPKDPGSGLPVLVYRGGKFYPKQGQPGGPTSAADEPMAPMTPGSENRTRLAIGLGPAVNAQRNIYAAEGGGDPAKRVNPYNKHPIASAMSNMDNGKLAEWAGFSLDPIARAVGGQEFQDYEQASKSFEAAMLPIFSGAAVTPSEAQRARSASIPQLGDTPKTLERKATNRAMMINAAADLAGKPRPFPKVGTWDFQGTQPGSQPREGQPRAPNTAPAPPQPGQVVKGYRFKGGNPADRNSWEPAR